MASIENKFLQMKEGQDFVNLLERELSGADEAKNFGLVAVFGSKEIGHDIDVMFYPAKGSQKGEFIKAQIKFLTRVKERLNKDAKSDIIPFPMLELQDEVEYLSKRKANEVFMHNLTFSDYKSLVQRVPFFKKLVESPQFEVIHGSKNALNQSHASEDDYYYFTLVNNQVLLSNYPKKLLSKKIVHIADYVQRHTLGERVRRDALLSPEECTKIYFETLDMLDARRHLPQAVA